MGKSHKGRKRPAFTVTVDPELLEWVEKEIEKHRFASRSHAIDMALFELKNKVEGEQTSKK